MTVACALALSLSALLIAGSPPVGAAPSGTTWPLDGAPQVEHGFQAPAQRWLAGHRGVDLLARPGDSVLAPMDGTIEIARTIVDRGVVVIRSGDTQMSLEPVTASVAAGDRVAAGDPVGVIGQGRNHCAPSSCLHWGLRVAGEYHDPLLLVRRYRAVLLP